MMILAPNGELSFVPSLLQNTDEYASGCFPGYELDGTGGAARARSHSSRPTGTRPVQPISAKFGLPLRPAAYRLLVRNFNPVGVSFGSMLSKKVVLSIGIVV
jgi:hypothetical protein